MRKNTSIKYLWGSLYLLKTRDSHVRWVFPGDLLLSVGKGGRSGSGGEEGRACVGAMEEGETGQDVLKTNKYTHNK